MTRAMTRAMTRRTEPPRRAAPGGRWTGAMLLLTLATTAAGCGPCRGGGDGGDGAADGAADGAGTETAAVAAGPNVLLLSLDTTRADVLGCYGHDGGATPTLDALAAQGALFVRAYTVTPLTIPAHSSLFTGLYPPRHGVRDNGDMFLDAGAVTLAERLHDRGYHTMASVGAEVTSHHWGFDQGFDAFFDDMGAPDPASNRWRVERRGDLVVDDALGWLEDRGDDGPWFAWVHLFDAHAPYRPPEPQASAHAGHPYVGEVAFVDSQVGRLVQWLSDSGRLDDTWIIALGDHGEGLGSHGEQMHGVLLYEPTVRVPMIIRPPRGLPKPRKLSFAVSLVDVVPTVLSMAGATVPTGLDGVDLTAFLGPMPVTESEAMRGRRVYFESLYAYRHYGWAPQKGLAGHWFKLIDSTTDELYERTDQAEAHDVSADRPRMLESLRTELAERVAAMEPAEHTAGSARLSPERIAQLEALGYVTSLPEPAEEPAEGLPDPVRRLPVLRDVERARLALQEGDLDLARRQIEGVIAEDPGLVEARILRGNLLWRSGELEAAREAFEEVEREHPSSATKGLIGQLSLSMGDLEGGLALLEAALETDPYLASAWVPYLHALFITGDLPRLEVQAARAADLLPNSAEIQGMQGLALALRGDDEGAEALLSDALSRNPEQPFLAYALGKLYQERGQLEEAESLLRQEVRTMPRSLPARMALVEIFAAQKRYAEQLAQLDAIVSLQQPSVLTMHSRAQCLFNLRRYDEAYVDVRQCVSAAPDYPACAMLEANVLSKLGRAAEAEAAFQRAVELADGRATGVRVGP